MKGVMFLPPLGVRTDKQRPGRRVRIQDEGRPELSEGLSANRVLLVRVFQVVLVESECSQESSPYSPLAFHVFPPEPPKVCYFLFYSKTPKQTLPSGKQQASAAKASGVTRNKANFQLPLRQWSPWARQRLAETFLGCTLLLKPEIPPRVSLAAACLPGCNQRSLSGTGG